MKNKSSGEISLEKFEKWILRIKAKAVPNWQDYLHGNGLNKTKISEEAGFERSVFKSNPGVIQSYDELLTELASNGIFKKGNATTTTNKGAVVEDPYADEVKDSAKVRDLKRIIKRLQNENVKLASELTKMEEFKEVLIEMGLFK